MKLLLLSLAALPAWAAAMNGAASFVDFDRRARAGESLSVVFFGASLTWGANATDPQLYSYRGQTARRLEKAYPKARFHFWDAAIGGTGSQLGVFRLDRDVLSRRPDLVFLDFSANDDIHSTERETMSSYEAIVRRLVLEARTPVVQVIFPFKPDAEAPDMVQMKRRDLHRALSRAYGTGVGDAIELVRRRIAEGRTTSDRLWPHDGGHPGNAGYELFAEAAWNGYREALKSGKPCSAPAKMLYEDTYMESVRARIAGFKNLPSGWTASTPNLTSAFYDMLMSRWLDDEAVASPGARPLVVKFRGTMALLFGESTPKSGRFRVRIDGRECGRPNSQGVLDYDAGWLGVPARGNGHISFVIAQGLAPDVEHTLVLTPDLAPGSDQEIRLESICVAGRGARVRLAPSEAELESAK